ncbi:molybdenum cofactor sulfurase [Ophiostoma piceae UAMH 11346]|uniref:Molybdenum cofactor sulfurase n=1 Tax=Ophiostoma piceae (strain UAMH 11346) TaxID=1262450 RepID=S3BRQ1_OPHP1|nr:molybdenum cofactor sulfurase [Ophiostoma piceae UAMH 11346]
MADGEGYNASVEVFRQHEYPMLKDNVYLDHAGTTLYSKSLVDCFAADMMANLLGNPHSASASSQAASQMVEDVRLQTLQFFGADPNEFDLVFVANATAGIKLVAEAFRALPEGFSYVYHQACHTSLVGIREEAQEAVCSPSEDIESWISTQKQITFSGQRPNTLFAYPAQSNMDGQRYPLTWASRLRNQAKSSCQNNTNHVWTLLDAAAYAATSPLSLGDSSSAPDFTVVSFYKIFGFPDLGGLIVRRQAESLFDARRYFGGGTVDVVVCSPREQWHASKTLSLHDRLEDGTLPVHSISALGKALQTHTALFGSMGRVSAHSGFLADRLYAGLASSRHYNGTPVCRIYSPPRTSEGTAAHKLKAGHGPVVAFNLQNSQGAWVSLTEFDKLATLKKFHIRTGGVCNPGGVADALKLEPWEMRHNFSHGLRCGSENGGDDIVSGKPTGIIRVSLAAMSTISDVDGFLAFIDEFYKEEIPPQKTATLATVPSNNPAKASSLYISSISVYPIKSCGAFYIPKDTRWEVRPEGLAWDREWCLVHQGTRRALSQKQYPQMVLLRPVLDFETGILRVSYAGEPGEISVPLSHNPAMFSGPPTTTATTAPPRSRESRVCGEEIAAQVYTCSAVNDFFTRVLGVPCLLARFPPGGQGKSMRHAKAHLQKHQALYGRAAKNSSAAAHPPSPPDSDSERATTGTGISHLISEARDASGTDEGTPGSQIHRQRRILLSNESPILAINMASLRALNEDVRRQSAGTASCPEIPASVFRANIVLNSRAGTGSAPYAEDDWSRLHIGQHSFKMLGSCRRCHMVCINQVTGAKSEEPFVTLTKTRRFDGKVFFGTHMGHDSEGGEDEETVCTREKQFPTIMLGDVVTAD